ncbi:hypothetical protein DY000_02058648 [Brassica cretica]|uniref:Uncharacterized protein n=1 Tax=Brassica cretica TaxID=69181 RepID=A0ABQ7AYG7_BRACR|nr:hypothetical protein DY000_02058648 [Brassica cretica]
MSPVRNLSSNIATTGSSLKVKGSTSKLLVPKSTNLFSWELPDPAQPPEPPDPPDTPPEPQDVPSWTTSAPVPLDMTYPSLPPISTHLCGYKEDLQGSRWMPLQKVAISWRRSVECGVSVPDDKRLFKLVSMSGALEELLVLNKKILDIQLHKLVSRHGAVTIYYLYLLSVIKKMLIFQIVMVDKVRIQSPFQVIVHHSLHIIKFLPSFSGSSGRTAVRGNAPVRDKLKGAGQASWYLDKIQVKLDEVSDQNGSWGN